MNAWVLTSLVAAVIVVAALAWLAWRRVALQRERIAADTLVERIDRVLPQTQCGQCSYAGCRPYAAAIARGDAAINQCPPGGDEGIRALAALLGRDVLPLNPEHGVHKPRHVALIDEATCIGCTKCIQACPVDAIVGASKRMHTVVAELCTGCELCVPPCPVDCIDLVLPRLQWRPSPPAAHPLSR